MAPNAYDNNNIVKYSASRCFLWITVYMLAAAVWQSWTTAKTGWWRSSKTEDLVSCFHCCACSRSSGSSSKQTRTRRRSSSGSETTSTVVCTPTQRLLHHLSQRQFQSRLEKKKHILINFPPVGVGKWVPASAGKAKAGVVHSVTTTTKRFI